MLSKKEFKDHISSPDDTCIQFDIAVEFNELINPLNDINDFVDDFVKEGYKLTDLSYEPKKVVGNLIYITVTCSDENFWDEE
jgi:hypothetical protein